MNIRKPRKPRSVVVCKPKQIHKKVHNKPLLDRVYERLKVDYPDLDMKDINNLGSFLEQLILMQILKWDTINLGFVKLKLKKKYVGKKGI